MHDDLIESGRRRIIVVAGLGIVMLGLALAIVFFPFALGVGALGTLLGGSWGYGWKLIGLSFGLAFAFALAIVGVGFIWVFRHTERELLTPMHAFRARSLVRSRRSRRLARLSPSTSGCAISSTA